MEIITNYRRASFVFTRLLERYRKRQFPYTEENLAQLPQSRIPTSLRGEANFYLYLCHFMRGRIESGYAVSRMVAMRIERPELFDPVHVTEKMDPEQVEQVLVSFFGRLPPSQRYGEAWFRNCGILLEWDGDVLNFFDEIATAEELRSRVVNKLNYKLPLKEQGLFMFQAKLCSMLAYFLMEAGLIPRIRISPPIDFHHLRVMLGTEMLQLDDVLTKGRMKPLTRQGMLLAERYLGEHPEVDPVEFADLLWVLSSYVCVRAVNDQNEVPDWEDSSVQDRYQATCGSCPVERQCQFWVPSSPMYRRGEEARASRVIEVWPRVRPPSRLS